VAQTLERRERGVRQRLGGAGQATPVFVTRGADGDESRSERITKAVGERVFLGLIEIARGDGRARVVRAGGRGGGGRGKDDFVERTTGRRMPRLGTFPGRPRRPPRRPRGRARERFAVRCPGPIARTAFPRRGRAPRRRPWGGSRSRARRRRRRRRAPSRRPEPPERATRRARAFLVPRALPKSSNTLRHENRETRARVSSERTRKKKPRLELRVPRPHTSRRAAEGGEDAGARGRWGRSGARTGS
jgi:hypothetical protein